MTNCQEQPESTPHIRPMDGIDGIVILRAIPIIGVQIINEFRLIIVPNFSSVHFAGQ
jgi:hypothetical protein